MSLKLFLLAPTTVFAARVNQASFIYPIDEVQFDTVTTGTYSSILPNMTVLFGSSAGASDLGITRVRRLADSDTLFFGRSSQGSHLGEVDLTDNCHVTILADYRVWSKTPFIDTDGTIYMDSDLAWSSFGQYYPPVANAGAALVATIDSVSSKITGSFDAANSFTTHPSATISAYGWTVGSTGTITVGTSSSSAITATWTAGFQWLTLAVADSNSQTHYTHVPVLAIDPENDPCISNFTVERHTIRADGQEMVVKVRESIPYTSYLDGTLAIVFDGEPASASDRSNIVMVGWIEEEPTSINATPTGTLKDVSLRIVDVAGRLKSLPGFPQIIEHAASPAKWGEMTTPNINRYIHHLLQWQTTALDLADYTPAPTGASYTFKVLGSDGASLFEQVNRRAQAIIPDHLLTCDTLGRLRVLPDPLLQATGDRTSTVQVTLDPGDYSDLDYTRQRHPRVHWLRSNAILTGTTAVATAFCVSPGNAPGQGETAIDDGEHLALTQSDLNTVTGHRYARRNAAQSVFRLTLAEGSRQGIEPAYMTWVRLTISSAVAAQRGLSFTDARCLCKEIDIRYQQGATGLIKTVTLQLEKETTGTSAVTVEVPAAEPVEDEVGTPVTPDIDPTSPPDFNGGLTDTTDNIALIHTNGMIVRTNNFTDASPNWDTDNGANVDMGGSPTIMGFVVDPFSPLYRGTGTTVNGFAATLSRIWKITDIFGVSMAGTGATELYEFDQVINITQARWRNIAASFGRYFETESDNPWIICATYYGDSIAGGSPDGTHVVYSVDGGQTWSTEVSITNIFDNESVNNLRFCPGLWVSPRIPGKAICFAKWVEDADFSDSLAYITNDWGASWTAYSPTLDGGQGNGSAVHIPWEDNTDESIIYYGKTGIVGPGPTSFTRKLYRNSTDITPSGGYGPRDGLFAVRTHDNNRQKLVMVGFSPNSYDVDDEDVGVFLSSDAGDTWTQIVSTDTTTPNTKWPSEAAFSANNENFVYIFGNEAYIQVWDNGTLIDKTGDLSLSGYERFVGLVGG